MLLLFQAVLPPPSPEVVPRPRGRGSIGTHGEAVGTRVPKGEGHIGTRGAGVFHIRGTGHIGTHGQATVRAKGYGHIGTRGAGSRPIVGRGHIGTRSRAFGTKKGAGHIGTRGKCIPSVSSLWSNGYLRRAQLRLPKWGTATNTMANFLLPVVLTDPYLKSTGNGGIVQSTSGWDIRFENAAGARLGHRLYAYDPAAGTVVALVNMARDFGAGESIFCFAGKSGLVASEEDAAAARAGGWVALLNGRTGADLSGLSHALTPANVGSTSLATYWPAGDYNGSTSVQTQAGTAAWLNGTTALSIVVLARNDLKDSLRELLNISVGTATELALQNTAANRVKAVAKMGGTVLALESADDVATQNQPQAVAMVQPAAGVMRLAVDGSVVTPAVVPAAASGNLSITDTLELGRGGRGSLLWWDGRIALLAIATTALPAAAMESMTAALIDSLYVYGTGAFSLASDATTAPVAIPLNRSVPLGTATDIDVVASAFNPSLLDLTIQTSPAPAASYGTVSIVGNKLRYTTTIAGLPRITYTLGDATGRKSAGVVRVSAGVSSAHQWTIPFPNAAGINTAKVKIWNYGSSVPDHDVGDVIVLLGNGANIEVINFPDVANALKGPCVVSGFTVLPRPSGSLAANYSASVKGRGPLMQPKFAPTARSHWTWNGSNEPFLWLSNIYIDPRVNSCDFFDIMKIYFYGSGPHDTGPYLHIFMQKIYMNNGPCYVSTDSAGGQDGHADGVQCMSNIVIRGADLHLQMQGGQMFFAGKMPESYGYPRNRRWELTNTLLIHQAKYNASVQVPTSGTSIGRIPKLIAGDEQNAGPGGENSDPPSGKYLATRFANCTVQTLFASPTLQEKKAYM